MAFRADLNTGIFSSGDDAFDIVTAGSQRLHINPSGFCGIGTATPQRILHSSAGSSDNCILATSGASNAFIGFADSGTTSQTGLSVRIGSSGNAFVFQTGGTNERMRIKSDGFVGIGTSIPQNILHVNGGDIIISDTNAPNIRFVTASNSGGDNSNRGMVGVATASNNFFNGTSANDMCIVAPASSKILFGFENSLKFRIDSDGKLFSAATYNNTTSSSSRSVVMPNNTGEFFASTSSRKFKTNITTLTDALADKILECRPVSFNSLCSADNKTKTFYGLIAEEVHEVDTSLVAYDDENAETPEPTSVQYDRFVPHLINLVKRQKAQIETLETKVATLEAS